MSTTTTPIAAEDLRKGMRYLFHEEVGVILTVESVRSLGNGQLRVYFEGCDRSFLVEGVDTFDIVVEMDQFRIETLAHDIASEVVKRQRLGILPLGRDSLYNSIREVAIAILDAEEKA